MVIMKRAIKAIKGSISEKITTTKEFLEDIEKRLSRMKRLK